MVFRVACKVFHELMPDVLPLQCGFDINLKDLEVWEPAAKRR